MLITREDLYRAVWITPAVKLAKEYGISDVALGKHCRRLFIPRPGKGYWARVAQGQRLRRPPLPPFLGADSVEIIPSALRSAQPKDLVDLAARLKPLRASDPLVPLATNFSETSPLIRRIRAQAKVAELRSSDNYGRLHVEGLLVTPSLVDRALLILDAVLKILQLFGCNPRPPGNDAAGSQHQTGVALRTGQDSVRVQMVEEVVYTKGKRGPAPYPLGSDPKRGCTARLELRILGPNSANTAGSWREKTNVRPEDKLNRIAFLVLRAGTVLRLRDERRRSEQARREEEWARRHEERERESARQREAEKVRQAEEAQRKFLEDAAERWTKCQQVRAYLAAYEAKMAATGCLGEDTAAANWLAWAKAYVESQDPLA